jgi:acyltransferase
VLRRSCIVLSDPVTNNRLDWIDNARGIGIFTVILVHSMIPMNYDVYLESAVALLAGFAIALFFIMAGMTYNGDKNRNSLKTYAISRGRQLLIPYFALYIIMMILFIPLAGSVATYLTSADVIFWFLYGAGPPGQATHLWFLPVLFFGLMLFVAIESLTHSYDPRVRWPLVVLLPVLAFWITDIFSPMLVPWRINSILIATAFCIVGHEMQRYNGLKQWRTNSKILDVVIFLILAVVLFVVSQYNGFFNFVEDSFGENAWLYLVTGTAGTILVFMLSTLFKSRRVEFLGVNSQVIYEIHPVFFYLAPVLMVALGWSLADYDASITLFWPLRFLLGFTLAIPFAMLVLRNRILSLIFTGKRNKNHNNSLQTSTSSDLEDSKG